MPTPSPEDRLGTVLGRKYRIERILDTGGMGVVYAATQLALDRPVAIKILLPVYAQNPDIARRFLTEARVAARLKHPHVVDVIDVAEEDDGTAYLVLEYLEGETLEALLARTGRLSASHGADILLPVMDALALAHARAVVHRDIKPGNVFIARGEAGEVPKLLDFGIAKVKSDTFHGTASGTVLGTVYYMAPEQARGETRLSPTADVWSMAVVWYECLAGALPFDGPNPNAVLFNITSGARAPLVDHAPDAPDTLIVLIERALSRDPDSRPADMGAFAREVRAVLGRESVPLYVRASLPPVETVSREPPVAPVAASPSPAPSPEPAAPKARTNLSWGGQRARDRVSVAWIVGGVATFAVGAGLLAVALVMQSRRPAEVTREVHAVVRAPVELLDPVRADAGSAARVAAPDAGARPVTNEAAADHRRGGRRDGRRGRRRSGLTDEW